MNKTLVLLSLLFALCNNVKAQYYPLYVTNHTDYLVKLTLYASVNFSCSSPACDASLVGYTVTVSDAFYPTTYYPISGGVVDPCSFGWDPTLSDYCDLTNFCYGGTLSSTFQWRLAYVQIGACGFSQYISYTSCTGAPATSSVGSTCSATMYAAWTYAGGAYYIDIYP